MTKHEDSLEVSALVWFDEEEQEWMYYVFIIHDDEEEDLRAWGSHSSKEDAAEAVGEEVKAYFSNAV